MKTTIIIVSLLFVLFSVPAYASASAADLFGPNDNTDAGNYVNLAIDANIDDNGINDDGSTDIIEPNNQPDDNDAIDDTTDINGQPDPFDTEKVEVQAVTSSETIIQVWSNGGIIVLGYYNEDGRQISVELLPIPTTTEPGGRGEYTFRFSHPSNTNGRIIVKAMLLDNYFRPICQADEAQHDK